MRSLICLLMFCLAGASGTFAQIGFNSPAGVLPTQDFEIYTRNGLLVQQKYSFTTADPNASVNTMSCAIPPTTLTSQAGILKDPGGDGNYPSSLTCIQGVFPNPVLGPTNIEIVFEELDTELGGDLIVITDVFGGSLTFSGSTLPAPFFITGFSFKVQFISNNNTTVGQGFRLRWRAVNNVPAPTSSIGAFGNALQFDVSKGVLVSGYLLSGALQRAGMYSISSGVLNTASGYGATVFGEKNTGSGYFSTAIGLNNTVRGEGSTAFGRQNNVSGFQSIASGQLNTVSGSAATAIGYFNTASGDAATVLGEHNMGSAYGSTAIGRYNTASRETATAIGYGNTASGYIATALGGYNTVSGAAAFALGSSNTVSGAVAMALGSYNTVNGDYSMAIGNLLSTAGFAGAMLLGDNSITNFISTSATAQHQFTARFAGGYRLFSNSGLTAGVSLDAGGTSWATISDSTRKERFLPIDGLTLLRKIGSMKLTTWNYKGQRDRRHYGPMAQEFFSLFGRDALGKIGCDTLITTQDMEGLTLSAVQALVKENEALREKTNRLESQLTDTNNRLRLIEQALLGRRRVIARRINL